MAVSRALRRLLHILEMEEEQMRLALESALGDLKRLERALAVTVERERRGRKLVAASAHSGELIDRLAGVAEARTAKQNATLLKPRIADAELNAHTRRGEFLSKRVERRQAETLIRETEAADAAEAGRRGQQSLDDWHLNRLYKVKRAAGPARPAVGDEDWYREVPAHEDPAHEDPSDGRNLSRISHEDRGGS